MRKHFIRLLHERALPLDQNEDFFSAGPQLERRQAADRVRQAALLADIRRTAQRRSLAA